MDNDSAGDDAEARAVAAAEVWLALVDEARYGESWDAAAEYLRNAVDKKGFSDSVRAARTPLGALRTRELQSRQRTDTLPGAPDGDYVVLQYRTAFEHKKSAVETVTPMLDSDGTWRVSGYYIR